jgi:hypothetical protein
MKKLIWTMKKSRYMILLAIMLLIVVVLFHGCSSMQRSEGQAQGWQILIKRYYDENRDQKAELVRESLRRVQGVNPQSIHITKFTDHTDIAYGQYSNLDDPNAKKDLQFIKSLVAQDQGVPPFYDAHLEPVSEPDPPIQPEWVITHTKGYWTLQIAQFYGEKRKTAAVELVGELRKEGIPGYVYHGPVKSLVMIGSYPYNAVQKSGTQSISQDIIPADPDLQKWKANYPYMIINTGYAHIRETRSKKQMGTMPSQIIKIPRPGASLW